MDKEFVPYAESLELRDVGFDEPCICGYSKSTEQLETYSRFLVTKDSFTVDAPTFSQAFRFFREKYNLIHEISWSKYKGGLNFDYDIFSLVLPTDDELGDEDDIASDKSMETYHSLVDKDFRWHEFNTPEEAELACLRKLIEIVKSKQ